MSIQEISEQEANRFLDKLRVSLRNFEQREYNKLGRDKFSGKVLEPMLGSRTNPIERNQTNSNDYQYNYLLSFNIRITNTAIVKSYFLDLRAREIKSSFDLNGYYRLLDDINCYIKINSKLKVPHSDELRLSLVLQELIY